MKLKSYIAALHAALFAILLAVSPAGSGSMMLLGAGEVGTTAPPAYSGPGDIVTGAFAWWGIRAYTAAGRGTKVATICNSTGGVDVGCADFNSDATTGIIESKVVSGITCPGANCTVATLYDQSGNTNCTTACNLANATISGRPTLDASCIGSLPCLVCGAVQTLVSSNIASAQAQPYTMSSVAERTTFGSNYGDILGMNANGVQFLFDTTSGNFALFAGTVTATVAAAENTFHAIQGAFNGSSSAIFLDGGSSTGLSAGAAGLGTDAIHLCNGNNQLIGKVTEAGIWASAFNGTQAASMNSNQRSVWGF